jgi:hypothetical protein
VGVLAGPDRAVHEQEGCVSRVEVEAVVGPSVVL